MEYGHLTLEERTVIMIYVREGQGPAEAARRLGCAVGTVKSRLSRGRERLRARLTRRGLCQKIQRPGSPGLFFWPAPYIFAARFGDAGIVQR